MKSHIDVKTRAVFAIALAILVGMGLVAYQNRRQLIETSDQAARSQDVLNELEATLSTIKDAETGRRGYVITGDERHLTPYNAALQRINGHIHRLRDLTAPHPEQQRHLENLEPMIGQAMGLLMESVYLQKAGRADTASQIELTERGKRALDEIRAQISEMKDLEYKFLGQSAQSSEVSTRNTIFIFFIGTPLGLGLLFVVFDTLGAEISERKRAQEALEKARAQLETKVAERTAELKDANQWLEAAIAERERAQEAILQLAAIVESSQDSIIGKTLAGIITSWNAGAEKAFGYTAPEVIGRHISILVPIDRTDEVDRILETVKRGERVEPYETVRVRKDGRRIEVFLTVSPIKDVTGKIVGASIIGRDVTERKHLEEQLRLSQRMEAVGRLAGGIAHDFNNLLTIITGYGQLLLDRIAPQDPSHTHIREIKDAANRAASLTRQLLAFGRRQVLAPQLLDLDAVVANMDRMLHRLIGEDVELVTIRRPGLGWVKADPGQIEQVIMNLAVNARDAMPQGGRLTIETANVELDEAYARSHISVGPGRYVMLAVSDTGCGMDAETQAHIFEPFFTTKEKGKGTGLGLSTVYGIVKQSGGNIWVYSEPEKGTTFKVYLPRTAEALHGPIVAKSPATLVQGSETILVVEDESALRSLVQGVLQSNGYTVLQARTGPDAISLSEHHPGKIQLLLTDVVMPRMGGRELAERLALLHPEVKVLYMSGYADDAVVRHGVLEKDMPFLQKPFTPDALTQKVRQVLDAPPQNTANCPAAPAKKG